MRQGQQTKQDNFSADDPRHSRQYHRNQQCLYRHSAAQAASDVVMLSGALEGLADLVTTSRAGVRRMRENIWLSALYNIVAVPLALVGLATPFLAAIAMSLSSVTVALNALRKL